MNAQLTIDDKVAAIETLYSMLPVGVESVTSTKILSEKAGMSHNQADRLIRALEGNGILARRTQMGFGGKVGYWTLIKSKDEAIAQVKGTPRTNASLRTRILNALEIHGPFETVHDILLFVARPGESIDLHNITHLLKGMRQQGILSFKQSASGRRGRGKGNATANVPYGIALNGVTRKTATVEAVALPEPEPRPEPTPEPVSIMQPAEYPLIQKVINRRILLEQAALLADQAGEVDFGITLLEKAKSTLSPYDQEVLNLWAAYEACKNS